MAVVARVLHETARGVGSVSVEMTNVLTETTRTPRARSQAADAPGGSDQARKAREAAEALFKPRNQAASEIVDRPPAEQSAVRKPRIITVPPVAPAPDGNPGATD